MTPVWNENVNGHDSPLNTGMTSADIINLVQTFVSLMIFVGLAFWFIRYKKDQNAKEREKFLERDGSNDRRAFELAEHCNQAMSQLAQAVDANTKAIEENGKAVAEMVNLLRAKVIQLSMPNSSKATVVTT